MKLSIVVPIYNEAESLCGLHREIVEMCRGQESCDGAFEWEVLFVDDGSDDETAQICKSLRPLRYIRLKKNYGQTAALDCGFKEATGDYVAALDGDGQNDPADIPYMLQYLLNHDLDMVCGWRKHRQDKLSKRVSSRGAHVLRQVVLHDGVHDSGCTLKVFRRECVDGLTLHEDQHRFIPAIFERLGYKVGEVQVNHRPRAFGKSKYNSTRLWKGLRDMTEIKIGNGKHRKRHAHDSYVISEEFENVGEGNE